MPGMNRNTGRAITGAERDKQRLNILIQTPVGMRVQRRDFGTVVPYLVDQPLNAATVLRMYSATASAVKHWLPDIQLDSIRLENIKGDGKAQLALGVTLGANNSATNETLNILINGGIQ